MKIKVMLLMATLFVAFGKKVQAQESPLQFGVKAGANLSNYGGDADGTDAKFGFNAGVTVDYAITSDWYLMSGLEFTTKGAKIKNVLYETTNVSGLCDISYNAMYLQLPIHIGYKLPISENTKLVFHAGPYLAYGVGGKSTIKIAGYDLSEDIFSDTSAKRFDFGLGLGAGVEFGKINIGLGYDFGLVNINQTEGTIRNMNGYLSLGYKF